MKRTKKPRMSLRSGKKEMGVMVSVKTMFTVTRFDNKINRIQKSLRKTPQGRTPAEMALTGDAIHCFGFFVSGFN
ncbi:hypothetical protein [Domibacillus robiginosus]|uniref:hypothetical protein n=1 Tax=Domibacillus robiginosus TaxID=1071054 RepID=UPI00067C76DA|nr:hypothetical protein [Domibacillus robiginosus]